MPSKLGFLFDGCNPSPWFGLIEEMRPTVTGVIDFADPVVLDRLLAASQFLTWRKFVEGGLDVPPERFVEQIPAKLFGRGYLFQGPCEPECKTREQALRVSAWFQRFGELMKANGEDVVAFDFSTGNPPIEVVEYLDPGLCKFIGIHRYYSTSMGYYMCYFHRAFYAALKPSARRPIIGTEIGKDDGMGYEEGDGWLGKNKLTPEQMMEVFRNSDAIDLADDFLVGDLAFQVGAGKPYESFALDTIAKQYAGYVAAQGGGKRFVMPHPIPQPTPAEVIEFSVSPDTIQKGQKVTVTYRGEQILKGWLVIGNEQPIKLSPAIGTLDVALMETTTIVFRVLKRDNTIEERFMTITVTDSQPPAPEADKMLALLASELGAARDHLLAAQAHTDAARLLAAKLKTK